MALERIFDILSLPNDCESFESQAEHHKRLRLQLDAAQGIISGAIKVDEGALRHQERTDLLDLMREELAAIKLPSNGG